GRSIRVVTTVAAVWLTAEIINLVWPRPVFSEWYLNWGAIIMTVVLGLVGALIVWRTFRRGGPAGGAASPAGVGAGRGQAGRHPAPINLAPSSPARPAGSAAPAPG